MLHIRVPAFVGAGKLMRTYGAIFTSLGHANVADVVISLVCLALLLGVKMGVNERFKDRLKIPVPVDLLLVICCTLASHFGAFHDRWGVSVVGPVPRGFPVPRLPDTSVMSSVAGPSFPIAVLIFVLTALLGDLCARVHGLQLDNNQEMVAYGLTNLASAFFPCFPSCTSPPRTMLLSALGARTTLHALPALVFMVLVLLVAGPLFEALPLAMLAAMIAVAMKDLLIQVRQLPRYWRVSKPDLAIWLVTWLAAALGDLDIGMVVGVVFSLLMVVVAGQGAEGQVVGVSSREDLCLPGDRQGLHSPSGARIFFFPTQLYFATVERFRRQLFLKVLDPTKAMRKRIPDSSVMVNDGDIREASAQEKRAGSSDVIRYILLDCSAMTYADVAGISMLRQVVTQYAEAEVEVLLAACPPYLTELLHRSKFFDSFPLEHCFHSVWDALHWLRVSSE